MADTLIGPANGAVANTGYEQGPSEPWPSPGTTWSDPHPEPVEVPGHLWPLVRELGDLMTLPPNWNSYGASAIQPQAVVLALRILITHGFAGPLPAVIPLSSGGVQLEWWQDDDGVEISCERDGTMAIVMDVAGEIREVETRSLAESLLREALAWARQP